MLLDLTDLTSDQVRQRDVVDRRLGSLDVCVFEKMQLSVCVGEHMSSCVYVCVCAHRLTFLIESNRLTFLIESNQKLMLMIR